MRALATNSVDVTGSGNMHESQKPFNISLTILRFFWTSPALRLFMLGIKPGFLTMNDISSSGSPPTG